MPLTDQDRERVRYHLGYIGISQAASMQFGIPAPQQLMFLVEESMTTLLEVSIPRVRKILDVLDAIELKMIDAQDNLGVDKVEELSLREAEPQRLEQEYVRWAMRLSDILGAPPYIYSSRFAQGVGGVPSNGAAMNIPVVRS